MTEIIKQINLYFKKKKVLNIIISISGGVDSVVLLHILMKIVNINKNVHLSLYHINYNTNSHSSDSYNLCTYYSEIYAINIYTDSINIAKRNFENNARKIRYEKLQKLSQKHNFDLIITAHNYNDQIETLIMKDEEGADWVSFLGIRDLYASIYRPMLHKTKDDVYAYANKNSLKWIEDPTNKDIAYRRNKIRALLS